MKLFSVAVIEIVGIRKADDYHIILSYLSNLVQSGYFSWQPWPLSTKAYRLVLARRNVYFYPASHPSFKVTNNALCPCPAQLPQERWLPAEQQYHTCAVNPTHHHPPVCQESHDRQTWNLGCILLGHWAPLSQNLRDTTGAESTGDKCVSNLAGQP